MPCGILLGCLLSFAAFALDPPTMLDGVVDSGMPVVIPREVVAGEYMTCLVAYTVGEGGIATGGGIRVQMPDEFHAGPRNSAIALQHVDSASPNFISANVDGASAKVSAHVEHFRREGLVKHRKPSLDGRHERYVFVVRIVVDEGTLAPGDMITVVYGDKEGGSPGVRVGDRVAEGADILIALDAEGDSTFQLIEDAPTIDIVPGVPYELQLHAPSQATTGETVMVLAAVVDKESNPVAVPVEFDLNIVTGEATAPERIAIPAGKGYARFPVEVGGEGIVRFFGKCLDYDLDARSNPIRVTKEAVDNPIYWGDVHSHGRYSWDGVGDGEFDYARNIAGLDFYTRTDHSIEPDNVGTVGLHADIYEAYAKESDSYNDPGEFVTILAYECSFGQPYGHHIVYFREADGYLANPQTTTLEKLWDALAAGDALTIPHHTGKFPNGVDFRIHDERFRRNFEFYSGHGLSEVYNPHHPLAFEHSRFTSPAKSLNAPSHAQDAWRWGLMLSTVSGSDDHRAQPGKPQYGLTAVRAESLTRDGVFQGLYDRHTYATTGVKIILDFDIDKTPMGQSVKLDGEANIHINAHGTDTIKWVELLRFQPDEDSFEVIQRWEPFEMDFEGDFNDPEAKPGTIYYTRLQQTNIIRDRVVMAWSSPIWIE